MMCTVCSHVYVAKLELSKSLYYIIVKVILPI